MPSPLTAGIECGHAPIDAQHADLFQVLELLLHAAKGGDAEAARQASERLVAATRAHFAWEEARMGESRYDEAEVHAEAHRTFLEESERLAAEVRGRGITPMLRLWLEGRYSSWFRFHTRGQDARLGRHLAWWEAQEAAKAAAAAEKGAAAAAQGGPPQAAAGAPSR
jgi:hemerythrin-like metal-binding protein